MENFSAPSSIDLFHLLFQLTIEHRIKIHLLTLLNREIQILIPLP